MKVGWCYPDLEIFYETYSGYCSSLFANKNVSLLVNDQSAKGVDLSKQIESEKQLEKLISKAWSQYSANKNGEVFQRAILDAYLEVLNKDLTQDPDYSPSLVKNTQNDNYSTPPQKPESISPYRADEEPISLGEQNQRPSPSYMRVLPLVNDTPVRPPERQGMIHSGISNDGEFSGFPTPSQLANQPTSPPMPLPSRNPRPMDSKKSSQMSSKEQPGQNLAAVSYPSSRGQAYDPDQSWGTMPANEEVPRFGPPIRGKIASNTGPSLESKMPPSNIAMSNLLKPEPVKPSPIRQPQVEAWEYKSDITYSQMVKRAPSESTLFNTPGMYETERQKLRDQLIRQREREFEDQLRMIRTQGNNEVNVPLHHSDLRANPSQIWSNQMLAPTQHSINEDYLKELQEKVFQSNAQFRKEQLDYQMLANSIGTYQKATAFFERETGQLTQTAADLTARSERLCLEISSLGHEKEDLLQKIERKRAELLEQKRNANSTSDSSQLRKRELLDEVDSMRRLAVYKATELSRVKAKYDELEREYHNHTLARTKTEQSPMKVLDRSLTASAIKDWAPWRERFEDNSKPKVRKTHADMGTTLTQGESASFLADLNRSVDNLLSNNSDHSLRKYRNL